MAMAGALRAAKKLEAGSGMLEKTHRHPFAVRSPLQQVHRGECGRKKKVCWKCTKQNSDQSGGWWEADRQ